MAQGRSCQTYHVVEVEAVDLVHVLVQLLLAHLFCPIPLLLVSWGTFHIRVHVGDVHATLVHLVLALLLFLLFLLLLRRAVPVIVVFGNNDLADVDVVVPLRLLIHELIFVLVYLVVRVDLGHLLVVLSRVPLALQIQLL